MVPVIVVLSSFVYYFLVELGNLFNTLFHVLNEGFNVAVVLVYSVLKHYGLLEQVGILSLHVCLSLDKKIVVRSHLRKPGFSVLKVSTALSDFRL